MDATKTPVEIVGEAAEALVGGDRERLRALLADECTYADNTLYLSTPKFAGANEVLDVLFALRRAFPDLQMTVLDVFSAGEKVAVEGIFSGTHTGEIVLPRMTVAATNERVSFPYCQIFTVKHGRITHGAMYYDAATAVAQERFAYSVAAVPV